MLIREQKEVIKYRISISKLNSWICFLMDSCKENVDLIYQKLVYIIQDAFIWDKETDEYIISQLLKI